MTSATSAHLAITAGCLSIIPLNNCRASSYPGSPGNTRLPQNPSANALGTDSSTDTAGPFVDCCTRYSGKARSACFDPQASAWIVQPDVPARGEQQQSSSQGSLTLARTLAPASDGSAVARRSSAGSEEGGCRSIRERTRTNLRARP